MFDNDDPFEDIVNQFFGNTRKVRRSRIRNIDDEKQNTQFIEDEENIYLIIETPGYSEKDINITIQENRIKIVAKTKQIDSQDYLTQKLKEGTFIEQILPDNIKTKNFKKTFKNGILEVMFEKR
jgi:HSP20 family molecular chaperone IbpA